MSGVRAPAVPRVAVIDDARWDCPAIAAMKPASAAGAADAVTIVPPCPSGAAMKVAPLIAPDSLMCAVCVPSLTVNVPALVVPLKVASPTLTKAISRRSRTSPAVAEYP